MTRSRSILAKACATLLVILTGCATAPPESARADADFRADDYPALFDAAREVLSDYQFTLDRIDAARGVITTAPKRTAGLATPWDREQSTARQEFEDLAHQHDRVARITFEPADRPTRVAVEVVVHRVHRPNWRIETDALRQSTHAVDPIAVRAGQPGEFREPVAEDRDLARRLMADIHARAGIAASSDDAGSPSAP